MIPIYKKEIDVLKTIKDEDLLKLLFVILVWSKTTQFGNTPADDREIAKIAGVKKWKDGVGEMLQPYLAEGENTEGCLLQLQFYKVRRQWRGYYRVLFKQAEETTRLSTKPLFYIESLETCIEELLRKTDIFYGTCVACGKKIYKRHHAIKYCGECRIEMTRKQKREYNRRVRYQQLKERTKAVPSVGVVDKGIDDEERALRKIAEHRIKVRKEKVEKAKEKRKNEKKRQKRIEREIERYKF